MKNEIIRIGQIGIRFLIDAAGTGGVLVQRETDFSSSRLSSTGLGIPAPEPKFFEA